MKKYYNHECIFYLEELWMEGLMRFCLNPNVCKQTGYENAFHDCTNCQYFVNKSKLLKEIIERQKGEKNETIDADKIEWEYKCISKEEIDEQPTVEAIPIEWIEKKAREFLMNKNFRWATDFQEVVDMWKVENNIPLFDSELKITLEKENEKDR